MVTWEKDGLGLPSSDYTISPVYKYPGSSTYSTSSRLNVSLTERDQESIYTCVVKHESSQELIKSSIEHVFGKWLLHEILHRCLIIVLVYNVVLPFSVLLGIELKS